MTEAIAMQMEPPFEMAEIEPEAAAATYSGIGGCLRGGREAVRGVGTCAGITAATKTPTARRASVWTFLKGRGIRLVEVGNDREVIAERLPKNLIRVSRIAPCQSGSEGFSYEQMPLRYLYPRV